MPTQFKFESKADASNQLEQVVIALTDAINDLEVIKTPFIDALTDNFVQPKLHPSQKLLIHIDRVKYAFFEYDSNVASDSLIFAQVELGFQLNHLKQKHEANCPSEPWHKMLNRIAEELRAEAFPYCRLDRFLDLFTVEALEKYACVAEFWEFVVQNGWFSSSIDSLIARIDRELENV